MASAVTAALACVSSILCPLRTSLTNTIMDAVSYHKIS
jgi:hypothetical protein